VSFLSTDWIAGFTTSFMLRKYYVGIAVLGLVAVLGSCTSQQAQEANAEPEKERKLQIAVIPKGSTHYHWRSVQAGAEKAAHELGDVEIIWQGPQKEDDRQMQIQVMQNMVSRGVDAILLAPLDDQSLVPSVKAAVNRHIPVIIFDSDLKTNIYDAFVATDNFEGGRLCAQRLAEVMGGKGKVIMLKYSEGSEATIKREEGFLDGLKEYGPGMELISGNQFAGATFEKAFQASQNLLNRFSDFQGVFCSNETSTQGMLRALQVAGRAGKVKFVGFDLNQTLLAGLTNGEIHGLAVQDPVAMGYLGVKTAHAILTDEAFDKRIDTGVTMVHKDNLNEPNVQVLLNPGLNELVRE
jgi:ribose transport system substrate-binding protein